MQAKPKDEEDENANNMNQITVLTIACLKTKVNIKLDMGLHDNTRQNRWSFHMHHRNYGSKNDRLNLENDGTASMAPLFKIVYLALVTHIDGR